MPRQFQPKTTVLQDVEKIVRFLQKSDLCQDCLKEKGGLDQLSHHPFLDRLDLVPKHNPGLRVLLHPASSNCPACQTNKRTVYTLAPSHATGRSGSEPGALQSLEQDLRSFLSILEGREADDGCETEVERVNAHGTKSISVFGPFFVGTEWPLWYALHLAIEARKAVRFQYIGRTMVAAPLHLWWAQGSWYLFAQLLEPVQQGRAWRKVADGIRSGISLARIRDLERIEDPPLPDDLLDPIAWLGGGDWLFRNEAAQNEEAVVLLGRRLLHYFQERLIQGQETDLRLWRFSEPIPEWVRGSLPPSVIRRIESEVAAGRDPGGAFPWYGRVDPGEDAESRIFLADDLPAALVRFDYPAASRGRDGRHVGEFEAVRRVLSWGAETVVLAPKSLACRVEELARILRERQGAAIAEAFGPGA